MRLWSIHPKYLDRAGLLALWRESLLAQKVLYGATKGYRHHPQLNRFRSSKDPMDSIRTYLHEVLREGKKRGYRFRAEKIGRIRGRVNKIRVTTGQIKHEFRHLLSKLQKRSPALYTKERKIKKLSINPVFRAVSGKVEDWERS